MRDALRKLYLKRSVEAKWAKKRVTLDLPIDVFSSFQVDIGTAFLLREISNCGRRWQQAADVGCGYGTIGLYLRACHLAEHVEGIDRDLLAASFAQTTAQRNGITGVTFHAGIANEDLGRDNYDLIVSNVPAKAGRGVHEVIALGAADHLTKGGEVWLVVVEPLEAVFDEMLDQPCVEMLHKARRKGHVAYHYRFHSSPPSPHTPYHRGTPAFRWRGHEYTIDTCHGLQEFDTLSTDTELILDSSRHVANQKTIQEVYVHNPGHGHLPILLSKILRGLHTIVLSSRDLLALRVSSANLKRAGFSGEVQTHNTIEPAIEGVGKDLGLIVARLEKGLGIDVNTHLVEAWLAQELPCPVILGGPSALLSQLTKRLGKGRGIEKHRIRRSRFSAIRLG